MKEIDLTSRDADKSSKPSTYIAFCYGNRTEHSKRTMRQFATEQNASGDTQPLATTWTGVHIRFVENQISLNALSMPYKLPTGPERVIVHRYVHNHIRPDIMDQTVVVKDVTDGVRSSDSIGCVGGVRLACATSTPKTRDAYKSKATLYTFSGIEFIIAVRDN